MDMKVNGIFIWKMIACLYRNSVCYKSNNTWLWDHWSSSNLAKNGLKRIIVGLLIFLNDVVNVFQECYEIH